MTKKWVLGLVGAFAVLAMAGVGFSAFTATATVNGSASAANVNLQIVSDQSVSLACEWLPGTSTPYAPAVGNATLTTGEGFVSTATFAVGNLTPGVFCAAQITLENTGSVPETVSVVLNTQGANGICAAWAINCFDVATQSGIQASGWYYVSGSPTAGTASGSSPNFVTLPVGGTYADYVIVLINTVSTSAPASSTFSLVYTASAGE